MKRNEIKYTRSLFFYYFIFVFSKRYEREMVRPKVNDRVNDTSIDRDTIMNSKVKSQNNAA